MQKHKVQIKGMHCSSCEVLIHKEVSKIPGVKYLEVSHKTGVLEIIHDESLDKNQIEETICRCGYKTEKGNEGDKENKGEEKFNHFSLNQDNLLSWLKAGSILVILAYIFTTFSEMPFFKNATNVNQSNLSLSLAFIVGLVASVSTCLAVVGSVVLGVTSSFKAKNSNPLVPSLVFQAGRIISFFVLGGILGLIGTNFRYSPVLSSVLNIAVAAAIGYLALSMLNFVPPMKSLLSAFSPQLGQKLGKLEGKASFKSTFLLGGLTFFLPCGFTQSMQVLALSQADFLKSGLIMVAFALGTAPVLLGVGALGSSAKTLKDPALVKVIALVLVFFAFFNFNTGLALNGFGGLGELGKLGGSVGVLAKTENGKQIIEMEVNNSGYTPAAFTIKKDVPVEWRINATALNGCNSFLIMQSFNISQALQAGLNTINFTPSQAGRLNFSCGMGMIRGYFDVVENGSAGVSTGAIPVAQVDQKAAGGGSCGGSSGGCGCGRR